jgi:hypothetical protein
MDKNLNKPFNLFHHSFEENERIASFAHENLLMPQLHFDSMLYHYGIILDMIKLDKLGFDKQFKITSMNMPQI